MYARAHTWIITHKQLSSGLVVIKMQTYCHMNPLPSETRWYVWIHTITSPTGRRRCIGCLKLHITFCKRATNYRNLLRKMTSKDKASYGSPPPCNGQQVESFQFVVISIQIYGLCVVCIYGLVAIWYELLSYEKYEHRATSPEIFNDLTTNSYYIWQWDTRRPIGCLIF